jgi:hypothetical protein
MQDAGSCKQRHGVFVTVCQMYHCHGMCVDFLAVPSFVASLSSAPQGVAVGHVPWPLSSHIYKAVVFDGMTPVGASRLLSPSWCVLSKSRSATALAAVG